MAAKKRQAKVPSTSKQAPTMTVDAAAKLMGIGRNRAYEAAHAGQIPAVCIGKRYMVLREPLERMLRGEGITREVKAA